MKRTAGLTILELLVVVLVVAILASIATPNYLESSTRSRAAKMRAAMRQAALSPRPSASFNTESYHHTPDNPFLTVALNPRSTFSTDVDTASYANMRRFIREHSLPPADAIRIEELVNYFDYDYPAPTGGQPLALHADVGACPWNPGHRLARIALKARAIEWSKRPACNLVFLVDTSGSMEEENKLPLVKRSLRLLVEKLSGNDRVAIVTYAGSSGLALPSTACADRKTILKTLDRLEAAGSTNGAGGLELAYATAAQGFIPGGINRVILATDGDFNVGITDEGSLISLIEAQARSGVTLSVLGYGMGNLKDSNLESLAGHGNGNYAYIDSTQEARKALVEQIGGTMMLLARDAKIQVEFNPARVAAYRLIGYEDRLLRTEDFKDDAKDAGDIGPGHCVTAFYELVPPGAPEARVPAVDPLKYSTPEPAPGAEAGRELMQVKLRYQEPQTGESRQLDLPVADETGDPRIAAGDFKFAAAVAQWGLLLRQAQETGQASVESVAREAAGALGADPHGYRREFLELVRAAAPLMGRGADLASR